MKKKLRDCTVIDLKKCCVAHPICDDCPLKDCLCGGFDGLDMEIDVPDIELPKEEVGDE